MLLGSGKPSSLSKRDDFFVQGCNKKRTGCYSWFRVDDEREPVSKSKLDDVIQVSIPTRTKPMRFDNEQYNEAYGFYKTANMPHRILDYLSKSRDNVEWAAAAYDVLMGLKPRTGDE